MKNLLSRRNCMKYIGIGSFAAMLKTKESRAGMNTNDVKLAIDRSNMELGNRPMYLRAYHPPYIVYYYAALRDNKITSEASIIKWKSLVDRVENEPKLVIRLVEAYDDACAGCRDLKKDPRGSAWGVGYSCSTIKKADIVREVTLTCRRMLGDMGLYYGSEIRMRDLVPLLAKNVPVLHKYIGGENNQEYYDIGLKHLMAKYGV